jgi:hypothetical protein
MPKFSPKSLAKLNTCHPDLIKLFSEVIKTYDCTIICGHRGPEDQEQAFREGKSKLHYPESRHNSIPSEAVDVCPYPLKSWDHKPFTKFSNIVKETAKELGIEIEWGGDFKGFFDGPHIQLKRK